jgi:hypothetical protein
LTKIKRRPKILEHGKGNAGEAVFVRAFADLELKLSAIYHMVGPLCISGDEILKSAPYKALKSEKVVKQ